MGALQRFILTARPVSSIFVGGVFAAMLSWPSYGQESPEAQARVLPPNAHLEPPHIQTAYAKDTVSENIHTEWTYILGKYVSPPDAAGLTRFDYAGLQSSHADQSRLSAYIKALETVNPETLGASQALAFYANLYNAVTVQLVAAKYPIKSIRDLGWLSAGPWKKKLISLNGQRMNLDGIEKLMLQDPLTAPDVHYMLNCASVGCPNLSPRAWAAKTLSAQTQMAAKAFVNSPRGVRITENGLELSKIYKWYSKDFGSEAKLRGHILSHANPDLAAAINGGAKITGYAYDWSLNSWNRP